MEMIRTFIIALFFAAVTVGAYSFINHTEIPWNTWAGKSDSVEVPEVKIEPIPEVKSSQPTGYMGNSLAANPTDRRNVPQDSSPLDLDLPDFYSDPPHSAASGRNTYADSELPPLLDVDMPEPSYSPDQPTWALPDPEQQRYARNPQAPSPWDAPKSSVITEPLNAAVRDYLATAETKLQEGKALEVLKALSQYYGDPRFKLQESEQLTRILVQAATHVIYSQEHTLQPPYTVRAGDTLESISEKYRIPAEFVARINGITGVSMNEPLRPGTTLKVLRGPFNAIVYVDRHEMILTLDGLFAGRFWIGVGRDLVQKDGDYAWQKFLQNPDYHGEDRISYVGQDRNNPLGGMACHFENVNAPVSASSGMPMPSAPSPWGIVIHRALDSSMIGKNVERGHILLSRADMESMNVLLGRGSVVSLHHMSPYTTDMRTASSSPAAGGAPEREYPPAAERMPEMGYSQDARRMPGPGMEFPADAGGFPNTPVGEPIHAPINSFMGNNVSMPEFTTDEMPGLPGNVPNYIPGNSPPTRGHAGDYDWLPAGEVSAGMSGNGMPVENRPTMPNYTPEYHPENPPGVSRGASPLPTDLPPYMR